MTQAIPGSGVVLKREGVAVAEVKGVRGPGFSSGTADVTSFDSAGWREFISTLRDGGTLSFSINFNPSITNQMDFYDDFADGTTNSYSLDFPDSGTTTLTFDAFCTGFEVTAELEQAVKANVTLKVSGAPVWS